MPRLDNRAALERFGYDTQMVMTLLLQEINALRQAAGLPLRTPAQVRQALRQYLVEHPRPPRQGG
jgi:hypothetical protein